MNKCIKHFRYGTLLFLIAAMAVCFLTASRIFAAQEGNDMYDRNLLSSENYSKYFSYPCTFHTDESGEYIETRSNRFASKFSVDEDSYTLSVTGCYTVDEHPREIPLMIGINKKGDFHQFYVQDTGVLSYIKFEAGQFKTATFENKLNTGVALNEFVDMTIVVNGNKAMAYLNGEYMLTVEDDAGFKGGVGFRYNTPLFLRNMVIKKGVHIPNSSLEEITFGDSQIYASRIKRIYPLQRVKYEVSGALPDTVSFSIKDADGYEYASQSVESSEGIYTFSFVPIGKAGTHKLTISASGQSVTRDLNMIPATMVSTTNDTAFNDLYTRCISEVDILGSQFNVGGETFALNVTWLRDHIHILRTSKYLAKDIKSGLDFWIANQNEKGFFYEILLDNSDMHLGFVDGDCIKPLDNDRSIIRLEIENDIEYLVVQGVYETWKATGDDAWAFGHIESLSKALTYSMTDPIRWDSEHGLLKRPVSIDTWDFVYHQGDRWRMIEDDTPMGIFHGDNTGFYQACNMLSEMYSAYGDSVKADYWRGVANDIKTNLMLYCWNGDYFIHQLHTSPTIEECDETWRSDFEGDNTRFSQSNAYALTRGIFTVEEASKVIETYIKYKEKPELFAEWVTIYPPYENTKEILYMPDDYVNGTVSLFAAGELARGCAKYGYEGYCIDILSRVAAINKKDKGIGFFYHQDGSVYNHGGAGGPVAWGASALSTAIIEGVAGFSSSGNLSEVSLSPIWSAGKYSGAYMMASYSESNDYVCYTMSNNTSGRSIKYSLLGSTDKYNMNILMPDGSLPDKVMVNSQEIPFELTSVRTSAYATFSFTGKGSLYECDTVEVFYKDGTIEYDPEEPVAKSRPAIWPYLLVGGTALLSACAVAIAVVYKKKKG